MTYPRLIIDTKKIKHNTETLVNLSKKHGIDVAGVTKVFCAMEEPSKAMIEGGVKYLADSRIENLKKLKKFDIKKILLRLPMKSQVQDVVKYSDISLNSELETIRLLSDAAIKLNKIHEIIIMVDLGDLREGFYYQENIYPVVEETIKLRGIRLVGLGTNLTCYGGVIPEKETLCKLVGISYNIKKRFGIELEIISGGNSSSVHLLGKENLEGINNIRIGEAIVCGRESAYGERIKDTYNDAFTLEAEIIEVKDKPSVPTGKIGLDAFGNVPTYVDRGIRTRAICAVGRQDIDLSTIFPFDENIIILGGSSDHTILDVSDSSTNYKVGDVIKFYIKYASVLTTMTSEYVKKVIIWW